jgi:hypothetical protein
MKIQKIFNKNFFMMIYVVSIVFLVLQNPYLTALNIIVNTTQTTETVLNILNGAVFQGSCLIFYSTTQYYVNSTQLAYKLNVTSINFMSISILILPIIIYIYFTKCQNSKKKIMEKKLDDRHKRRNKKTV